MWIELHDGARDHPKILKLSRDVGVTRAHALGLLASLWTWALRMAPDGDLSSFDAEDIELGAGWEGETGELYSALISRKLLDKTDGGHVLHDWDDYSGSLKIAERKRRERSRKRRGGVAGQSPDTPPLSRDVTQNDRPKDLKDQNENAREGEATEESPAGDPSSLVASIAVNQDPWKNSAAESENLGLLVSKPFKVIYERLRGMPWDLEGKFRVEFMGLETWCRRQAERENKTPEEVAEQLLRFFFADRYAEAADYPPGMLAKAPGRYYKPPPVYDGKPEEKSSRAGMDRIGEQDNAKLDADDARFEREQKEVGGE